MHSLTSLNEESYKLTTPSSEQKREQGGSSKELKTEGHNRAHTQLETDSYDGNNYEDNNLVTSEPTPQWIAIIHYQRELSYCFKSITIYCFI